MVTSEQVTAALKKLGAPSSPTSIANALQAEVGIVGYRLRAMLDAKEVKAGGAGRGRVYGLPDQKFEGGASRPKKSGRSKAAKTAAAERFIPTVDATAAAHPQRRGSGVVRRIADQGDRHVALPTLQGLT
jgi:hypothetical protein